MNGVQMSQVNEQAIFLQDACKLAQYAASIGFIVTGGELLRTEEQQEIYIKTGLTKTKNSRHLLKCAIDLNFFLFENGMPVPVKDIKKLRCLAEFWNGLDKKNDCGINWGWDLAHFERRAA